jgi:hypothetical protein
MEGTGVRDGMGNEREGGGVGEMDGRWEMHRYGTIRNL